MDLEQLLANIEHARDQAKADADAFQAEAASTQDTGALLGATLDARAAVAVEAALSRILGETRTRPSSHGSGGDAEPAL